MTAANAVTEFHHSLCREHLDEGAFLWLLRDRAAGARHWTLKQLVDLDASLEAHVDGLRVAAQDAWTSSERFVEPEEPGDVFLAGVLAIEDHRLEALERLFIQAEKSNALRSALLLAFGWVAASSLQGIVKDLLNSRVPSRQALGIVCCALHRVDPGRALDETIASDDAGLATAALEAAGALGRHDLLGTCERHLTHGDARRRLAAGTAAVLLGARTAALDELIRLALSDSKCSELALLLAVQAAPLKGAHEILQVLARDATRVRCLILGSGVAGDPAYVRWLIGHMTDARTARLAAAAFSLITGADLLALRLDGEPPTESALAEDVDSAVDAEPDEGLPWPDIRRIQAWWDANSFRFDSGSRYFLGAEVTREHCIDVLKKGYQLQRILAARYLCLLDRGTPLFNTSAPAWRQQRLLAKME